MMSDLEQRLFLREILAMQLFESNVRAAGGSKPEWYLQHRSQQDLWRSRAAKLVGDEMKRVGA